MDAQFLTERITSTQTQITAMETALEAFSDPDVFSYTIDTGQTRQTVTRNTLGSLQTQIDSLYNRLATLEARLNGAVTIGRPGF